MSYVEIKFAEINGLYSYGSEKNRIDFGQKTVIVGTNNSGKSAIFKALNYLIKCLTESNSKDIKPWDLQDTHEITVGLVLNDTERRYMAEILAINAEDGSPVSLAPNHVVEWLAPGLEHMEITVSIEDNPYLSDYEQIKYAAYLKYLDATVCSQGWSGSDTWVCKSAGFSPHRGSKGVLFYEAIKDFLEKNLTRDGVDAESQAVPDWPTECKISRFPEYSKLAHSKTPDRKRLGSLLRMLKHNTRYQSCSFFTMLGIMLEQRFVFVSEQRKFQKTNGFEMLPLKADGSNLQGFLYWLQNGDRYMQDACSAIRKIFTNVVEQQNLSFLVSVTKREESPKHAGLNPPKGKVHPGRAIVRFAKQRGQPERFTDFMDIGAGVRETLFLLATCFGRQDQIILLDEPAANLHPTQIRRLMIHIMSANVKSGQVAVVTHSPALASLDMLSSVNEIVRIDRREHSRIMQPSGEDREWMKKNLPTFHLLKSDILFAKKVILVEGNSDKIFLEAILNHGSRQGDDIAVVDVGGVRSFGKFRKFLEIFDISYGILADKDGKKLFDPPEILELSLESTLQAGDRTGKKVCLLEKDLESLLAALEPKMYGEIEKTYGKKPECTYQFIRRFFGMGPRDIDNSPLLNFIREWSMKY